MPDTDDRMIELAVEAGERIHSYDMTTVRSDHPELRTVKILVTASPEALERLRLTLEALLVVDDTEPPAVGVNLPGAG